jgi:threonine synthase
MTRDTVQQSLSPSMDIQVSSNFERLLFEVLGRDADLCAEKMNAFAITGNFDVSIEQLETAKETFVAYRVDDAQTTSKIKSLYDKHGIIFDPHSAVGLHAAASARDDKIVPTDIPIISLACAHPAKFPDAVEKAIGIRPDLPEHLRDLMDRKETKTEIDGTVEATQKLIYGNAR